MGAGGEEHWNAVYAHGDEGRSWTEDHPNRSLALIQSVVTSPDAPIIDVGGGSSGLAQALLAVGYRDITVLDLAASALELAQQRLGPDAGKIRWLLGDLLAWRPERQYELWHDRALLHFFTARADRLRYAHTLRAALAPGGHVVIATFAPNGPRQCSGLPALGSSADALLELLGHEFVALAASVQAHRTPSGVVQPFTWLLARRKQRRRPGRPSAGSWSRLSGIPSASGHERGSMPSSVPSLTRRVFRLLNCRTADGY